MDDECSQSNHDSPTTIIEVGFPASGLSKVDSRIGTVDAALDR